MTNHPKFTESHDSAARKSSSRTAKGSRRPRVEIEGRWLGNFYNFNYHLLIDGEFIAGDNQQEKLLDRAKFLARALNVGTIHFTHADPQPEGFKPHKVVTGVE